MGFTSFMILTQPADGFSLLITGFTITMTITQHSYRSRIDQQSMLELARQFPDENLHVSDLPYRFSSWAFDDPLNVSLWLDNDKQLVGWAVLQAPFWSLDYAFHPDFTAQIHPEILAWSNLRLRQLHDTPFERPAWFVNLFEHQHKRRKQLEQAGFVDQGDALIDPWSKVWLVLKEAAPLSPPDLPPEFTLRPLAGLQEINKYVDLHQAVFESKNMTIPWRQRTLEHPAYSAQSDLVAVGPDGELAAFCIGWYNPAGSSAIPHAQIEPMGVAARFRGLGLGRAVLSACLARLRSMGARQIYVETDNNRDAARNLYKAVGFELHSNVRVYRKIPPRSE